MQTYLSFFVFWVKSDGNELTETPKKKPGYPGKKAPFRCVLEHPGERKRGQGDVATRSLNVKKQTPVLGQLNEASISIIRREEGPTD